MPSKSIYPVTTPESRALPQVELAGKCDRYVLRNGVEVPCLGFGTYMIPNDEEGAAAVRTALELGFRHIDGAANYNNEDMVGRVLAESGIPRNEVFITSKLKNTEQGYEKTLAAFDRTLADLGTDYLDLYLIHWPKVAGTEDRWEEIIAETWRAFEELYEAGRVRAIGVSNFLVHHLETLERHARIMPMVDQIELNPTYQQRETVAWCEERGIQLEAWAPLGPRPPHARRARGGARGAPGQGRGPGVRALGAAEGLHHHAEVHEARAHQVEQRGLRLRALGRGHGAAR